MIEKVFSPVVSVVIPSYNRPKALPKSVASALTQGLPIEVIIVDDASTDESPLVAHALAQADPRVRFIALPKNCGGGHARNVGIDAAQAPWLAMLDSDDVWLPGKLQAQLTQLQALAGPHGEQPFGISFTNLLIDKGSDEPPTPWNTLPFLENDSAKDYLLAKHQYIQTSTLLMPTSLARKVRFNDRLRRHQDTDFVIRAEAMGARFHYLDQLLVHYSADPKAVRVSGRVNPQPSLHWMEVARDYLTPREIASFYLCHVYDLELQVASWRARQRGWQAMRTGAMTPSEFVWRSLKLAIPQHIKDILKGLRNA